MASGSMLKMKELELEDSETEENDSDWDVCDTEEINRQFAQSKLLAAETVAKNAYLLHLACTQDNNPTIGAALSNDTFEIFSITNDRLAHITALKENDPIVDCKFNPGNNNLLYTCSRSGSIKLWDLRKPLHVGHFTDSTSNGATKTFNCFDVSPNERLLTAGTDLFEVDSFLLFWDLRKGNLLGGYWESHRDDITQVKFDQNDSNKLISGSTDGLINIYDLSESNEDDALIDSLNTNSSVEVLDWYKKEKREYISCITHTADLQLWNEEDGEPYKVFDRTQLSENIKRKNEEYTYLVNTHETRNSLLILVGSNAKDGQCLRSLHYSNGILRPSASFVDNQQRVRCSAYNSNVNILITGGEKGILDAWKI